MNIKSTRHTIAALMAAILFSSAPFSTPVIAQDSQQESKEDKC